MNARAKISHIIGPPMAFACLVTESPGMKKSLLGPQGPLFAIQLAILFAILLAIHVGLLDRKFAHERAWYALWSSFFPASLS